MREKGILRIFQQILFQTGEFKPPAEGSDKVSKVESTQSIEVVVSVAVLHCLLQKVKVDWMDGILKSLGGVKSTL